METKIFKKGQNERKANLIMALSIGRLVNRVINYDNGDTFRVGEIVGIQNIEYTDNHETEAEVFMVSSLNRQYVEKLSEIRKLLKEGEAHSTKYDCRMTLQAMSVNDLLEFIMLKHINVYFIGDNTAELYRSFTVLNIHHGVKNFVLDNNKNEEGQNLEIPQGNLAALCEQGWCYYTLNNGTTWFHVEIDRASYIRDLDLQNY